MKIVGLATRLLWRESRSGELTILVLALLIAVTCSTAIGLFSNRLEHTMTDQAADFMAADLVITGHSLLPDEFLQKAVALKLTPARTTEFSNVLMENDEFLLVGIKAVSDNYPLRGILKSAQNESSLDSVEHHGPVAGTAWVDKRVLSTLKLKVGDSVNVGEIKLLVTKILTYETDKQGDIASLSPRLMMNLGDLPATGIIQPGSHVHYFYQFIGKPAQLALFTKWVKPKLNLAQKLVDIRDNRPELNSALSRAERYLGLSSIVVLIISGVAIAMATGRFTERHLDSTAILRCLGCKQSEVIRLFLGQFFLLGLMTSCLGGLLGWIAQDVLFLLLKSLLPQAIAKPSGFALLIGPLTGYAVLLTFAMPPLLRLKSVSPARVLRRDLEPIATRLWIIYGLAGAFISGFIWRYTKDFGMMLLIFCAGLLLVIVLGLLIHFMLRVIRQSIPRWHNLIWRFGLQGLVRNSQATTSQILAFSITLTAMALSFTVRNDLVANWQTKLPKQAPNHFAINIIPDQLPILQQAFINQGITGTHFYPVVRGRLVKINRTPVEKLTINDSLGENAIHRELNLSWKESLPDDNRIIAGEWWQGQQKNLVSVEQKLSESLNIHLGDLLTFMVGSQPITAVVSSIRALQWDTMKPNFYMLFSPGSLDSLPSTFITSFYLPDDKKTYLSQLVKQHPAMTVLAVDALLDQLKTLLKQLTQAINYLLYFALLAGFTVLFSAIYSTLDNRIYESAMLRTFGASRAFLQKTHIIEFTLLGFLSGLLAVIISEALLFALYTKAFAMHYEPTGYLWLSLPLIGATSVGLVGYFGVRRVSNVPPIYVLKG